MRVVAGLLVAVLVAVVAACGEGESAPSAVEDPTITTTTDSIAGVPAGLTGTELHVHGDMYGTLTDEAGNAIGVPDPATGVQLTSSPGATYHSTGDDEGGQYLVQDGVYKGAWTVEEDDEVRFVVRNYAGDTIAETAATLPFVVRAGDKITMSLGAPADLASLELTVDGRDDRTVPFGEPVAGNRASDRIQPVSRITVKHVAGPNGTKLARVTIFANDMGGAGIARIEYGISPSNESGVYTEPFEVPAVGRIAVRAIDLAGNIEAPYPRASLAPKG